MSNDAWRGKVGQLEREEIDAFLAEPNIARLACLDRKGWPYVVPCWQEWDGESFWLVGRERSAWARYLAAEPRCAITVDEAGAQRKVIAQCVAHVEEAPGDGRRWLPVAQQMSARYLGQHDSEYLVPTLDKPRWLIRLEPRKMRTWQGQDWPQRYK